MKKAIPLFLFITTLLLAESKDELQSYYNKQGSFTGGTQDLQKDKTKTYLDYDEIIYEHYKLYKSTPKSVAVSTGLTLEPLNLTKEYQKILAEAKQQESAAAKDNNVTEKIYFIDGFCYAKNDIEIVRISSFATLNCDFSNGYTGSLTAMLVPDFYSRALIGQPLYVSFNEDPKKRRFIVQNGVIMNPTKTNLNIANVVNDRLVERIVAETGKRSAEIATQQSIAYLEAKKQSAMKTSVYNDGNFTVAALNYEKPNINDYVSTAGVQIVSEIIKAIGDFYIRNLDYSFKINKNAMFYVDFSFSKEGVKGITPSINFLVKEEPPTEKSSPEKTTDKIKFLVD